MVLYFRRAADQFARAGWEPSNEDLAIMSGETCVGTLVRLRIEDYAFATPSWLR